MQSTRDPYPYPLFENDNTFQGGVFERVSILLMSVDRLLSAQCSVIVYRISLVQACSIVQPRIE